MYMQRILFILTVAMLSLFAGEAYAQRDLPGQTGVQFTTGESIISFHGRVAANATTSPRWPLHIPTNQPYLLAVWSGLSDKKYTYENKAIPKRSSRGLFYSRIVGQEPERLFPYRTFRFGRLRDSQLGNLLLPDGAAVTNGDCFIYGGGLTAAFDVWLTDRIILLMQVK